MDAKKALATVGFTRVCNNVVVVVGQTGSMTFRAR